MCFTYALTLSSMFYIYFLLVILSFVIFLINLQPYKASVVHYTTIDASFLILFAVIYTTFIGDDITAYNGLRFRLVLYTLGFISCVIPIIYISFIVLHWIYSRRKWGGLFLTRVRDLLKNRNKN